MITLSEPVFAGQKPTQDAPERFLLNIFHQDLTFARRRPENNKIKEAESNARLIAKYNAVVGKTYKKCEGSSED